MFKKNDNPSIEEKTINIEAGMQDFVISGFWPAFFGSLLFSAISLFLSLMVIKKEE